ncbi:hypothetical protein BC826DRAFT_749 [Russula brevipes]|nr:hypothetical protein BC826DRAFT_749 [Russula brevipes]
MTNIRDKQKVTSSRLEELRPHVQDSHLDDCPLTMPSHMLPLDQLRPSVAAIQSPSGTLGSDTTFDTFRANYGQSRFFQYSQGEIGEQEQLQRQPTILSLLSLPSQAPEELVYLLGNRDGKLKAGATIQPRNQSSPSPISPDNATTPQKPVHMTTLERAKRRSRVALNLVLAGDTFVQGQTISGQLIVNVHNAEFPVRLANNNYASLASSPSWMIQLSTFSFTTPADLMRSAMLANRFSPKALIMAMKKAIEKRGRGYMPSHLK